MRIILSFLVLALVIVLSDSCKKKGTEISSTPSQLWFKVNNDIPDFTLEFISKDIRNNFNSYSVSYSNKEFSPNLKTVTDVTNNETWVLVFKSLHKTDEINLQLNGQSKKCRAKGFDYGEKRFIEVVNTSGVINVLDRDISSISSFIWFE